jgi:hypothetical protein
MATEHGREQNMTMTARIATVRGSVEEEADDSFMISST